MILDPTIISAIESGQLSVEQLVAAVECLTLKLAGDSAVAQGFDPACVRFMIDERAELLRAERPGRVATLQDMLACGATSVQ